VADRGAFNLGRPRPRTESVYFLEMVGVMAGAGSATAVLPSGWAAVLYLYDLSTLLGP
jgi:hypothetical protein